MLKVYHHELNFPWHIETAWKGIGSFITFDFIRPGIEQRTVNKSSIWVYLCDWTIMRGGSEICRSDTFDDNDLMSILRSMGGLMLNDIFVQEDFSELRLDFSAGWSMTLDEASDLYHGGKDLMNVFTDGDFAFAVSYPDGFVGIDSKVPVLVAESG